MSSSTPSSNSLHENGLFFKAGYRKRNILAEWYIHSSFLKKCLEDISLYCGITDAPVLGVLMKQIPGFKAMADLSPLAYFSPVPDRFLRFT